MNNDESLCCEKLTQQVLDYMRKDGYSYSTTDRKLIYIYRTLTKFCNKRNNGIYSSELGKLFLSKIEKRKLACFNSYIVAIRRLDQAAIGNFHWKERKSTIPYKSSCFDPIIVEYEKYLYKTGKTEADVRNRVHVLARFFSHSEKNGITKLSDLNIKIIYSGFMEEGSKEEFKKSVGSFFKYAYRNGEIPVDLSNCIPAVNRHTSLPSVYSIDEINTILSSINRNKANGKRNYAIILIASRTGLRSCDIANLKFSDIHLDSKTISVVQKKTGSIIEFPLLEEIENAIEDYVKNARPKSDLQNIFLTSLNFDIKPLKPHLVYCIVARTIQKSGINPDGRKLGAHALRSSLASQLLDEGNSYQIIQKVLGHTSPDAAKHYVRVEIKKLKECALSVRLPSDELLSFLRKEN